MSWSGVRVPYDGSRRGTRRHRRTATPTTLSLLTVLLLLCGVLAALPVVRAGSAAAAVVRFNTTNQTIPLLLIHGYNDDCGAAWNTQGYKSDNSTPLPAPNTDAYSYFSYLGAQFGDIKEIGYYTTANSIDGKDATGGYCNEKLNGDPNPDMKQCNAISTDSTQYGTDNDHLDRLSCLLAWYIYDTYTRYGEPVNVLAHSMGGLLIRYALGAAAARAAQFPPVLWVNNVVTVATPHGGIYGPYYTAAAFNNNSVELQMMDPGSSTYTFMKTIFGYQKPQGYNGTRWALVGAFDGAYADITPPGGTPPDGGNVVSYTLWNLGGDENSDGIVPTDSQFNMTADYKIAYGVQHDGYGSGDVADWHTQYEHETGIGCLQAGPGRSACFNGPFYLNDSSTAQTMAWTCGGCSANPGGSPVSAPHSLAVIVKQLQQKPVPNLPSSDLVLRSNANEDFVSAELGYTGASYAMLRARSATKGAWESWTRVHLPDGHWLIRSDANGEYVSAELGYTGSDYAELRARTNASLIGPNEVFDFINNSDGTYSLKSVANGMYVSAELGYIGANYGELRARSAPIGPWEEFNTGPTGWVIGHAQHAGNDYPYETIGQFEHQNEGTDAWNEYYGQCDSFAAWKTYENRAGSNVQHPGIVPAPGWTPSNASINPVNQFTWGNADVWASKWQALGYTVDTVPAPGAIAYWPNAVTDPQDGNPPDSVHGIGEFGHLAYVTDVYTDGSITIEQYNMRDNGEYSIAHMAFGQGYTDNSFGQGNFSVPWPKYFIHVNNGPAPGAASPAEPGPGVVQATYPSQVKVIGPGSSGQFATGNVWYTQPGHGELGTEMYTHTNGPAAVSTATWTPSGLAASACYQVDAFVPDNYSDNPTAIYTVTDATGTSYAAVNENVQTNDWSELGVFKTNSSGGGLSVRLDDRGNTNLFVAADAMRFWRQPSCGGEGDVSPIFMPTSHYGSWTTWPGHGFFGTEQYTTTTGTSTSDHSATWTPGHLLPYGCYDVSLYVPDNYSDNPGALYYSNDAYYSVFYPQIDENAYTNQFAWIGTFQAYSDGTLPVELFNEGPSGEYVAADAIAYTLNPHCMAENGAVNAFGSVYTSSIIGPGSGPPNFSTTNDWYNQIGHGYANHQLWTHTNGTTPVSTATWTFYGTANACYTATAFIPINSYANNTNASYTFDTQVGVIGTQINQATTAGWTQFQGNPKITTGSNGQIIVNLNDTGPVGTYTAADAISFTQTAC